MIKKFEAFDFKKTESSKIDKLYLFIMFEGGDADTKHPEYIEFKGIKFSEYKDHLDEIQNLIDKYKILKGVLDINSRDYCKKYNQVVNRFGREIADLYDQVPNDPQCDFQFKCYIDRIKLVGYDENGNKHESYA